MQQRKLLSPVAHKRCISIGPLSQILAQIAQVELIRYGAFIQYNNPDSTKQVSAQHAHTDKL